MAVEQICIPSLPCPKCGRSYEMHKLDGETMFDRHYPDCDGDGDTTRGLVELTMEKKGHVVSDWNDEWRKYAGGWDDE